jgi:DNA-binding MarR family transcriptional regulator
MVRRHVHGAREKCPIGLANRSANSMTPKKTAHNSPPLSAEHRDLITRVEVNIRKMGAQSVITSQTMTERFGLHTTDLKVLDLIFLREQASAGELANATGLTSGSVTALIDRLVKAGYVDRHADPGDRRRVIVRIRRDAIAPIEAAYASMQTRMVELWSTYSAQDLEIIADFLSRSTDLAIECTKEIRETHDRSP